MSESQDSADSGLHAAQLLSRANNAAVLLAATHAKQHQDSGRAAGYEAGFAEGSKLGYLAGLRQVATEFGMLYDPDIAGMAKMPPCKKQLELIPQTALGIPNLYDERNAGRITVRVMCPDEVLVEKFYYGPSRNSLAGDNYYREAVLRAIHFKGVAGLYTLSAGVVGFNSAQLEELYASTDARLTNTLPGITHCGVAIAFARVLQQAGAHRSTLCWIGCDPVPRDVTAEAMDLLWRPWDLVVRLSDKAVAAINTLGLGAIDCGGWHKEHRSKSLRHLLLLRADELLEADGIGPKIVASIRDQLGNRGLRLLGDQPIQKRVGRAARQIDVADA